MRVDWIQYFQFVALALSIFYFSDLKKLRLGGFTLLMFVSVATELIAGNRKAFGFTSSYTLYDYYLFYFTPITLYIFFEILKYTWLIKGLYLIFSVLLMAFILFDFYFWQGQSKFNTYSFIAVQFTSIILSTLVITKLFMEDDTSIQLIDHPYFWISGSTLIFSFGAMVALGLQQFILLNKIQVDGKNLYRIIMPVLNVILYGGYSYAFILCRKLTTRLSLSL